MSCYLSFRIRQFSIVRKNKKTHECWHESPWIVWELPRSMKIWSALKCPGLLRLNRSKNPLNPLLSPWRWPELIYLHITGQSGHSLLHCFRRTANTEANGRQKAQSLCFYCEWTVAYYHWPRPFSKALSFNNIVTWR